MRFSPVNILQHLIHLVVDGVLAEIDLDFRHGFRSIRAFCCLRNHFHSNSRTLLILLSRVFLGAVFSGQMMTLFYSLGGGLLAWLIMCLLRPVFHKEHLWLCSPVAALFHNLGQLLVAAAIMRTWAVLAYLPYLALSGVITGLFTGLCTQFLMARLKKLH